MNKTKIKIVLVDDEAAVTNSIKEYIESEYPNWNITCFNEEFEALGYIKDNAADIDILICDIDMPNITGLAILEAVKEKFPGILGIILSGRLDQDALIGRKVYADVSLGKPIKFKHLCSIIFGLVSQNKKRPNQALHQSP